MVRMYAAAAEGNLSFAEIYQDYNTQPFYEDYNTSTNISNETEYSSFDEENVMQKPSITLFSIIFVLGIIGNGLVIWIAGFRMKKTIGAVWFLNLAIADFLCCASLPLRITEWVVLSIYFTGREFVCKFNIILFNLNVSASVFFLTAMSIDRCVSVMWPFWAKVHRTRKLVRNTAAMIWVFSLLLTGLLFYLYKFYFVDYFEWCIFAENVNDDVRDIKQSIRLCRLFIMFVIPFLIILISYVIVFFKIRKSKRSQRSQRPYRIITAVILGFFICWLPYYIWPLTPFYEETTDLLLFFIVDTLIANLACLNSCINPIIYVFMGQDFNCDFFRSIPARVEKALSEHPNDLCREREDCDDTRTTDV